MLSSSRFIPLLLTLLPLLPLTTAAPPPTAQQGSVSLWSDSGCSGDIEVGSSDYGIRDPVALNYTLAADECGNPGVDSRSYVVNKRPTCANGTVAAFAFYYTNNCVVGQREGAGWANNQFNPSTKYDGECLALVKFGSVAFICDGIKTYAPSLTVTGGNAYQTPLVQHTNPGYSPPTSLGVPTMPIGVMPSGVMPSAARPMGTGISARQPFSFSGANCSCTCNY